MVSLRCNGKISNSLLIPFQAVSKISQQVNKQIHSELIGAALLEVCSFLQWRETYLKNTEA